MPRSIASVMKEAKEEGSFEEPEDHGVRRVKSAKGVPVSLAVVEDSLRSKGPIRAREGGMP